MELKRKSDRLAEKYSKHISSEDLEQEMNHITMAHNANFDRKQLGVLELLRRVQIIKQLGALELLRRVQIRKHASQPQCQLEDIPYSTSHSSIKRKKLL